MTYNKDEELKPFPKSGPIPQTPLEENDDISFLPTSGRIPGSGADVNVIIHTMNTHGDEYSQNNGSNVKYQVSRRAPIKGSKKATVTGKVKKAAIVAIIIVVMGMFVLATAINDAKARLYEKYLPSNVDHVEWFDGFDAYDKYGHLLRLDDEDWEYANAQINGKAIFGELVHPHGRGGR